jgi:probable F420-dependent oxidoreductase
VKVGIWAANTNPGTTPGYLREVASTADEMGFESIWGVDHIVIPSGYNSAYPYAADGRMPGGEDFALAEPLVWLSYIAAITERLLLATGVMVLPQRNPLVVAKQVATLDRLSGGRAVLGVGGGWLAEESEALGVPFQDRIGRLEEAVEVMKALWQEDIASFEGDHFSFAKVKCNPKPVRGHVPIVLGGHSEAVARRAGRIGDGLFISKAGHERMKVLIHTARQSLADAGRDSTEFTITALCPPERRAALELRDLGVGRLLVRLPGPDARHAVEALKSYVDLLDL